MPSAPTPPPLTLRLFLDFRGFFCTIRQVIWSILLPSLRSEYVKAVVEDKQNTGQIFYARTLQILDRIGAHMTTLCVRPCKETLALKFNRDGARAGRMPKRWHTRLILEDKQDTGQIFYGRKVQILGDTV